MKHTIYMLLSLSMLLVFNSCGGSDDEPDVPDTPTTLTGTWTSIVNGMNLSLRLNENGTCSITFLADGSVVAGNYVDSGSQITFLDNECTTNCDLYCDPDVFGVYNFSISGIQMTLVVDSDVCEGRRTALTTSPWTKQ